MTHLPGSSECFKYNTLCMLCGLIRGSTWSTHCPHSNPSSAPHPGGVHVLPTSQETGETEAQNAEVPCWVMETGWDLESRQWSVLRLCLLPAGRWRAPCRHLSGGKGRAGAEQGGPNTMGALPSRGPRLPKSGCPGRWVISQGQCPRQGVQDRGNSHAAI